MTNKSLHTKNNEGFFNKRAGRKLYWISTIPLALITSIQNTLSENGVKEIDPSTAMWLLMFFLITFSYFILVVIWRLNDLDKPKWYIIGCFIPIVNFILGIELGFSKGQIHSYLTGGNKTDGVKQCPKCKRQYSLNKIICSYCKVSLQ